MRNFYALGVRNSNSLTKLPYFYARIACLSLWQPRAVRDIVRDMPQPNLSACAVIVAGGSGKRAANHSQIPKQLQLLAGKPVIAWSIEAFSNDPRFSFIVIVCPESMRDSIQASVPDVPLIFAPSGMTRTASVRSGLSTARSKSFDTIFIHDAARPGLDRATLDALFEALAKGAKGCAPTRLVADALWNHNESGLTAPQDRETLLRVQTPQAFHASDIVAAYDALPQSEERADDIAVARDFGLTIVPVAGNHRLDKITWPQDFARMAMYLEAQLLPRTATGFDAHKFCDGDYVTLCGIKLPHSHGLAGHSDADVGWHALADAIYGALGAGDIGHHFPPTDARWKGAASSVFLKHAGDLVVGAGGVINHLDVTLICERPKVGPYRAQMVEETAKLLGLRPDQVSIKATTTEGMGFTGRMEGIAAQATATIMLPETFRGIAKGAD